MEFEQNTLDEIAKQIHSDESPVGIDAKKTHVLILAMLKRMDERLDRIENRLNLQTQTDGDGGPA